MTENELKIWKRAFTAARRLTKAAPWRKLSNSDIFKLPLHDKQDAYILVLGNGGEMYGCSIFVGEEGYKNLYKRFCALDPRLNLVGMDSAVIQDCITLDLYSASEFYYLEQEEILETLGMKKDFPFPRLPFFEHYIPFSYPRECTLEELSQAAEAINQLLTLTDLFPKSTEKYYFGGFNLYTYDEDKDALVKNKIITDPIEYDDGPLGTIEENVLEELRSTPALKKSLELELITSQIMVSLDEGDFFTRFLLLSIENGSLYNAHQMQQDQQPGSEIVKALKDFIKENGRPKEIHVRNLVMQRFADVVAKPLGIPTVITDLDEKTGQKYLEYLEEEANNNNAGMVKVFESILVEQKVYTKAQLKQKQLSSSPQEYSAWLSQSIEDYMIKNGIMDAFKKFAKLQAFGLDSED